MPVLKRLPAWATTGVGGLPFDDPRAAAAHAVAAYDVPFCPQLCRIDGDMVAEWLGADPARCGWSPERDRRRPWAWRALLAELDARPPTHRVVKLQVTGPLTLAVALERERGASPSRAAARGLAGELATWLAASAGEQVRELAARRLDALLVVDEPALAQFGAGLERVWDPLRAVAPAWGLHVCCQVPWPLVERAEPDVLSLDLALGVDEGALRRLLARGTRIAWGALAVHRPEHGLHAIARMRALLARLPATGEQSLITAACGTGRMALRREAEVATALFETTSALRRAPTPAECEACQ